MMVEAVRERISADLPQAEARFRALTAGRSCALWIAENDYPDKMLALHARGADLIVAGRPPRGVGSTFAAKPADLVMEAGAPVLLAADCEAPFVGEHVLVAWKDARESRRALYDALPFLMQAKSVTVAMVTGQAEGDPERARRELTRRLLRHGVEPAFMTVPKGRGSVTEALEICAADRGADLIVAGAYGHSRVREWMLGGVTEDFVVSSRRFVLLSH
jgi:nucleotide-binding universal stress UspA family protein